MEHLEHLKQSAGIVLVFPGILEGFFRQIAQPDSLQAKCLPDP